jgi:hypothetical protein
MGGTRGVTVHIAAQGSALPGKFFEAAQSPLLCALARHIVSERRLSTLIDKIESPDDAQVDFGEYTRALDSRRKESAAVVSIMRALRLTNQSRYRPATAASKATEGAGARKLWEFG